MISSFLLKIIILCVSMNLLSVGTNACYALGGTKSQWKTVMSCYVGTGN